jgi:hypothetical protein
MLYMLVKPGPIEARMGVEHQINSKWPKNLSPALQKPGFRTSRVRS